MINLKIKQKVLNEYQKFLNDNKKYVGLSEWNVYIFKESVSMDNIATADSNIYEKEIKITLSKNFFSKEYFHKRHSILLHELVHARLNIYDREVEEILCVMQEHLANDLTRGLERALKK